MVLEKENNAPFGGSECCCFSFFPETGTWEDLEAWFLKVDLCWLEHWGNFWCWQQLESYFDGGCSARQHQVRGTGPANMCLGEVVLRLDTKAGVTGRLMSLYKRPQQRRGPGNSWWMIWLKAQTSQVPLQLYVPVIPHPRSEGMVNFVLEPMSFSQQHEASSM